MPADFADAASFRMHLHHRGRGLWSVQHGTGGSSWRDARGLAHLHPESRDGLLFDYDQALRIILDAVESVVVAGVTFNEYWRARHHDARRSGALVTLWGEPVLLH